MALIANRCLCQRKIAEMMEAHNTVPRKVWYEFPCIVLRTVLRSLDTIGRGLIIGYAVVKDTIDDIFWGGNAGIRLGSRWLGYTSLVGCAVISRGLGGFVGGSRYAGDGNR